jgi:hypothetical protein
MSEHELSKEERILRAVKLALTNVIKDTATQPGMKHPLKEGTIQDLRHCLVLISERERELAEEAGRPMDMRPRYVDEPQPTGPVEVPLSRIGVKGKKPN